MVLRDQRFFLLTYGISLALFEVMVYWMVASVEFSEQTMKLFKLLPPVLLKFFGEDNLGVLSPVGFISLGFTHPMIYVVHAAFPAALFGREITSARDKGVLELTLCKPLSRSRLIFTLLVFYFCGLLFICICQVLGVWLGIVIFSIKYSLPIFFPVIANLFCLSITIGGYTLFITTSPREFSRALTIIISLTAGLFFLEFLCRSIKDIAFLGVVNPFHYYQPISVLMKGGYPLGDMAILASAGLLFMAGAFRSFRRRDI